jgi:hypothetical protein
MLDHSTLEDLILKKRLRISTMAVATVLGFGPRGPNFTHFGPARDKTVPLKIFRPDSNFQPVLWPNKKPTDIPQPI